MPADARASHVVATLQVPTAEVLKSTHAAAPVPVSLETNKSKHFVPIVKVNEEEKTVTGIVLVPEEVDAHGDIYDAKVVRDAAHDFLSRYNETSTLGLMHKDMKRDFDVLESWIAPIEFAHGTKLVKQGTWLMTVRVNESKIWEKVKKGELTGFSIGGKATVQELKKEQE